MQPADHCSYTSFLSSLFSINYYKHFLPVRKLSLTTVQVSLVHEMQAMMNLVAGFAADKGNDPYFLPVKSRNDSI